MNVKDNANLGHLLTLLGIILAVLIAASGMVQTSYTRGQDKQDQCITEVEKKIESDREKINSLKVEMSGMKSDVGHIKETTDWIRKKSDKETR